MLLPSLRFELPWMQTISRGHIPLVKSMTSLIHVMWECYMGLGFNCVKTHNALQSLEFLVIKMNGAILCNFDMMTKGLIFWG